MPEAPTISRPSELELGVDRCAELKTLLEDAIKEWRPTEFVAPPNHPWMISPDHWTTNTSWPVEAQISPESVDRWLKGTWKDAEDLIWYLDDPKVHPCEVFVERVLRYDGKTQVYRIKIIQTKGEVPADA